MSTEQEKELGPLPAAEEAMPEPASDPMEDTDRIQKAIEKVTDEETAALPPLPLSGISDSEEDDDIPYPPFDDDEAYDFDDNELYDFDEDEEITSPSENNLANAEVHTWFFTFMCMNIPIVGWIYLLHLAFRKERTERRNFARAYLFYKLIFLLVSAVILGLLIYIGLGYLDQLLAYMTML